MPAAAGPEARRAAGEQRQRRRSARTVCDRCTGCSVRLAGSGAGLPGAGHLGAAEACHGPAAGPSRPRGPALRQPAPGAGPAGRAGHQPGRRRSRSGERRRPPAARRGVRLTALFSPEHGFRGTADPGAAVGLHHRFGHRPPNLQPLWPRRPPRPTRCSTGIDVLLVDLQDAGARYYTYLWTTVEVMRAAGAAGHPGAGARPAQPDRWRGAGERARSGIPLAGRPAGDPHAPRHDPGRTGPAGADDDLGLDARAHGGPGRGLAAVDVLRRDRRCPSFRRRPICGASKR